MADYLVEHRVRIRTRADDADLLEITSIRGGTNPYIVTDGVSGDGASFNPLTNEIMAASYTIRVADEITSGTDRLVTSKLEDVNGKLQLGYHKAYIERRVDGGSWLLMCGGCLTAFRLSNAATWELEVQDATRVQGGFELFTATSTTTIAAFLASWPNRGCLIGGPIRGQFLGQPDWGGWEMRVNSYTVGGRTRYWLEPITVYGPAAAVGPVGGTPGGFARNPNTPTPDSWKPGQKLSDFADGINQVAQQMSSGSREIRYGEMPFATIGDTYAAGIQFPGLVYLISLTKGGTEVAFRPIDPYHAEATDPRGSVGYNDLIASGDAGPKPGLYALLDGQTALTNGAKVFVRALTILPSEVSPIYLDEHPVTLLTQQWTIAGLVANTDAADALTNILGTQLRIAARIAKSFRLGEFLRALIFEPFQVGVRNAVTSDSGYAAGQLVPFSTAIFPNTLPTKTITDALVATGSVLPFDIDVTQGLQRVTLRQKQYIVLANTPDGIAESDLELTILNGDTAALPSGTVEISVPGMIHLLDSSTPVLLSWLQGRAETLFDRFGRGNQGFACDLVRGDGITDADTAKLGDELLVNVKQLPNHNKRLGDDPTVGARAMQVTHITELLAVRRARFADSGPNAQALTTLPTITIAQSTDKPRNVAEVTVTNAAALNALGYRVVLQMTTDPFYTADSFSDEYTSQIAAIPTTAIRLRPILAGTNLAVRARSEKPGARPSAWSTEVTVGLAIVDNPTSVASVGPDPFDGSIRDLSWVNGTNATDCVTDIWLRAGGAVAALGVRVGSLHAGSTRFRLEGLIPNTAYIASVQHRDPNTQDRSTGGIGPSGAVDVSFTTANTTKTVAKPLAPNGFSGTIARAGGRPGGLIGNNALLNDRYGIAVMATEFPSYVEVYEAKETAVGSGSYGTSVSVGKVPAESGDWTTWTGYAPNDGLRRKLKARGVKEGKTSSAFTDEVTVTPWVLQPIAMHPPPQGTVSISAAGRARYSIDGGFNTGSYKVDDSTSAYPADATVASSGTTLDGRVQNDVDTGTDLTIGQRIYITVVPFSGPNATGVQGPSIHLTATRHDFSATKTQYFAAALFTSRTLVHTASDLRNQPGNLTATEAMHLIVPNGVTVTDVSADNYTAGANGGNPYSATLTLYRVTLTSEGTRTSLGSVAWSEADAGGATVRTKTFTLSEVTTGFRYQFDYATVGDTVNNAKLSLRGLYVTYSMPSSDKAI